MSQQIFLFMRANWYSELCFGLFG